MPLSPESHIQSLEKRAENIQRSYHESTDLIDGWVDKVVWLFGGETVKNEYIRQMNLIKKQAQEERQKLLKAIADKQINRPAVAPLLTRLNTITKQELEDISFLQAAKNTDVVQAGKNAVSGIQWEVTGVVHSTVSIITWTFDLLKFLGKYSVSYLGYHPEYKDKVNAQAQKLYGYLKKEGMWWVQEKAVVLFNQEIERISKLPQEQQAKAIGNIAGNVIGMLIIMKAGVVAVEKIGKIGKQTKRGEIFLAREMSKESPNLARAQKLEWLLTSADRTKKTLTVANIALNGVAESIIWAALAKQLEFTLWFFENKNIPVDGKIKLLRETLSDLDNKYRTETDETKKQEILQVMETYKNQASVQKILKYQQKRDALLERAFQRSAEMFHIGEDILRKNPDIDWTDLAQQIEDHFTKQGAQLSKDQKEMLKITATSLEKAKQSRQMQLEEIFQKAGVTIPKKLEDIERVMNTNSNIQFEEWKNYSVERWGIDYLDTVLVRNEDTTLNIMKQEWLSMDIQHLTQAQKEKIVWHLEWWITAIKFNLTSHPTCIIHQFKEASAYINSKSVGHMSLWTWKIYVRGDYQEKDIHDTIEHEYQHFLNLAFVEPVIRQLRDKAIDWSWSEYKQFRERFGNNDHSVDLMMQWSSMKDEIASYLERDGTLAPHIHAYLAHDAKWDISTKNYWYNWDYIKLLDNILNELLANGAAKKDIVDIVRTSAGFEHTYKRLQEKYKHIIDFPIDMKQWKLKGIDEIITDLSMYNEAIGYDKVILKKNGNSIIAEYWIKIGNVHLDFHLETKTSDPVKIKIFLEDIYNKINSNPTIGIKPDQDEIKEALAQSIQKFWNAHMGSLWYIDHTLTLHSQEFGTFSLFDNSVKSKKVLDIFFLSANNAS